MPFIIAKTVTYVSSLTVTYVTTLYILASRQRMVFECFGEWNHVGHGTALPRVFKEIEIALRGRILSSPTGDGQKPSPKHNLEYLISYILYLQKRGIL